MVSLLKRRAGKPYPLQGRNEVCVISDQRQNPGSIPFCTCLFRRKEDQRAKTEEEPYLI